MEGAAMKFSKQDSKLPNEPSTNWAHLVRLLDRSLSKKGYTAILANPGVG